MEDNDSSSDSSPEEVKPDRQAKKELKREQRRQEHAAILLESKKRPYYNEAADIAQAEAYYKNIHDPVGKEGYLSLHELLSSTFKHARRRCNIFPIVDRHPDYTLRCVFTGRILQDAEGVHLERCDEEHSFPQSFQQGSRKGTGRDMHAIFAASKHANGSRGNKPFGKISETVSRDDERGTVYIGNGIKSYVPRINCGAVCRSTLYIMTCYSNCAAPNKLPQVLLDWAVEMAASEPVTLWEKHRNAELYRLQGNRNPFIDHPEWAKQLDFSGGYIQ